MDCPDCGGNHVIQMAHDVLCASTEKEAIYAFAELIAEDVSAAQALAAVLVIGGEPEPWDYMIALYHEAHSGTPTPRTHQGKTWRWGKRDPADTAQTVEEWMRINRGGDTDGKST